FSLWMNGFTAFSIKPLRLATLLGALSACIGFITGLIIIIRKMLGHDFLTGWSSTIAILLFMFGIVLIVLGLIGEYLGRIYLCINQTPQFVIRDVVNNPSTDDK
ncbi:MAG TPA: glycosyltransferase, partial [Lachnospiraceae bacterium]|nr:glycosyltransferase [Lachnospiraceae bacterium]